MTRMPVDRTTIEKLEAEVARMFEMLSEYDYFMGDWSPLTAPWSTMNPDYGEIWTSGGAYLSEGALLMALTVLWGTHDQAHSISQDELSKIYGMVEGLRNFSDRTKEIARVIDLLQGDEAELIRRSNKLFQKYVSNRRSSD